MNEQVLNDFSDDILHKIRKFGLDNVYINWIIEKDEVKYYIYNKTTSEIICESDKYCLTNFNKRQLKVDLQMWVKEIKRDVEYKKKMHKLNRKYFGDDERFDLEMHKLDKWEQNKIESINKRYEKKKIILKKLHLI